MGGLGQLARVMAPAIIGATSRAAWVLYAGLALAASLTLYGNGVQPADIVAGLRGSAAARLGVFALWTAVTLPVARASLVVPTTYWLRSLPVGRAAFWLVHGVLLVTCVEVQFVALLAAGGGLRAGAAAAFVPAAAHALLVAEPRRPVEIAALVALVVAVASGHEPVMAAVGAGAAVVGVAAAVTRAPELTHVHRRARVFGRATLALATAHLVTLWRRERIVLARGAAVALAGAGAAALGIRNNGVTDAAAAWRVLLAVGGATLPLAAVGVAVAAWHSERRHRWLFDAAGTPVRTRVHATAGVAIVWGALGGAAQAGLTCALLPSGILHAPYAAVAIVAQAAWGGSLAALVAAAIRRGVRDDRRDGERTMAMTVPLAVAAATGAAFVPLGALVLACVAGAALQAAQASAAWAPPELPPAPVEELA